MRRSVLYIAVLLPWLILTSNTDTRMVLNDPLSIPLSLSANFGELRSDHFHSGIDIKTGGATGKEINAADKGYIYRIGVAPGGFGKALYMRHENGFSTVYAHLDAFTPEIDQYVTEEQYRLKSFSVNLFPEKEKFTFERGDIIGLSGNTGSSQGPHLHFEVRRSSNENPVDPLKYYDIYDDIRPVIDRIYIYPLGHGSAVNGFPQKVRFRITGEKGNYRLTSPLPVKVWGETGIGVSTWDYINNSWNKCGVRTLEMKLDGKTLYHHQLDEFSFAETRYLNSHIDYEEYMESGVHVQRTFILPNSHISFVEKSKGNGRIVINDDKEHRAEIIVEDYNGNRSTVEFSLVKGTEPAELPEDTTWARVIPFGESADINRHDIRISFPRGIFYDTLLFRYGKIPGEEGLYSDIHHIHNKMVPVHSPFTVSIMPQGVNEQYRDKLCLVYIDKNNRSYAGGTYRDGFVSGSARKLGSYAVGIDTVPPVIRPINFIPGSDISGKSELVMAISDDFSGVSEYEVTIDGTWALFEWDPKTSRLIHRLDDARITRNSVHTIKSVATDTRGNTNRYTTQFYW
ncbi:MAG: M23 family metallopeptidase [Bacteroidales bacterium]